MERPVDCLFCRVAHDGLPPHGLYEDERFFVILDRESLGFGHCMIVSKRHVRTVYDLDEEEYGALFALARRLAPQLAKVTRKRAVGYLAWGSGLAHAHLHLVPHNKPEELLSPTVRKLSDSSLAAEAEQLKAALRFT